MIKRGLSIISILAKNKQFLNIAGNRYFSTKAAENLKRSLEKEITYEETNYQSVSNEDQQKFLKDNGFSFSERENSTQLELRKTIDNLEVYITFQAKPPMPAEENQQQEQQQQQGQEEKSPENMSDFFIILNKVGDRAGLLIEAVTVDTQIHINQIHTNDNIHQYYQSYVTGKFTNEYMGPDFSTLDERIQQGFMEFLGDLGINEETGSFIEVMSFDKDQRMYLNWLKNVKNFLI